MMMIIPIIVVALFIPKIYSHEIKDDQVNTFLESFKNKINKYNSDIQLQISSDIGLNITEFLKKHEYPVESHDIITEDGFILGVYRIPAGRGETAVNKTKPAILLVHGLLCSAMDWVTTGSNSSLALLLADLGYDVWMLNTRGTRYSMNHQTLNSSDAAFWDYSFHEKGYYDLAATIDYMLNSTGLEKITIVGHSEGTTGPLVLTTTKPEYNDKINLLVLLSPIAYMGGLRSPIPLLMVKYMTELQVIFKILKIYGISYSDQLSSAVQFICGIDGFDEICCNLVELLCGLDFDQMDLEYLLLFVSDKPQGMSVKELIHYGQEIISKSFRQYDFGLLNVVHYGQATPPSYNISKVTVPVAAYYGKNDYFSAVSDVETLLGQISNIAESYLIEYELFNHIDFIIAKDVKTLLYDEVLKTIEKYNPVLN